MAAEAAGRLRSRKQRVERVRAAGQAERLGAAERKRARVCLAFRKQSLQDRHCLWPADRAERVVRDAAAFGAEAVVVSRIPGASHCATEGAVIGEAVRARLGLPVVELEVPPVIDSLLPTLTTRLEALVETVRERRNV